MLVVDLKSKGYVILLFVLYVSVVLLVSFVGINIFFPERLQGNFSGASHNFVPFSTIETYLFNFKSYNLMTWFYNTFGNILLFIPMGILLPILIAKRIKFSLSVIPLFSLTIETLQYFTQLGVFDVDDIILNTLGGYLGFLIFVLFSKGKKIFN
ncbi:VanZ family protein [Lentibacillus jeotgali]|uniref:VanZ family protein n=1 Tax=Lentibacillus jeotgali TaxID=558169 RepID=UPI000262887F|nr:VanZ family protein [Lentibacillus jeotgali]